MKKHSLTLAIGITALVLAFIAVIFSIIAFNRSGTDIDTQIQQQTTEAAEQIKNEMLITEIRMRLIALRADIALNKFTDNMNEELAGIQQDLERSYTSTKQETKTEWIEIKRDFQTLDMQIRQRSVESLDTIDNILSKLRKNIELTPKTACLQTGGEWRTFSDACADQCGNSDLICAQVLTESCDCGADNCWNGKVCEPQTT